MNELLPGGPFTETEAMRLLDGSRISILVTDARQPDNPIIFVNRSFERVTGYALEDVMGQNCRFLQGEATDPEDVERLRRAIEDQVETTVDILNYRKDGETFLNRLIISPIFDDLGVIRYFLGLQKPLTDDEAERSMSTMNASVREIQHRVKNHLSLLGGLVRLERRGSADPGSLEVIERRIGALEALYSELSDPAEGRSVQKVSLAGFLKRLVGSLRQASVSDAVEIEIDCPALPVSLGVASKIGLIASEVLTNSLKYAIGADGSGKAGIRAARGEGDTLHLEFWDNGPGIPADVEWPAPESVGGRIMLGLIAEIDGDLTVHRDGPGSRITLDVPGAVPH